MAKFDLNDSGVVVIVGSGAGGGTLGNELAQKGVKVVILEAGPRIENQDFVNDEWDSFTAATGHYRTLLCWKICKPTLRLLHDKIFPRACGKASFTIFKDFTSPSDRPPAPLCAAHQLCEGGW